MVSNLALSAARILVVDDEPDLRTLYELTLLREGYRVETAESCAQARQRLSEQHFDVVITDMRLPDGLGLELIRQLKADQRPERSVVITAYGSADNAVESLKAGAFDYLTKPVDLKQFRAVIASAVQNPASQPARRREPDALPGAVKGHVSRLSKGETALERLVGDSLCMRLVRERIVKIARGMAPVLITGESGTGKELVASAIHANSHRAGQALIAVNCSAIPENLLEAEFFGARKGAYTGSTQDRLGYFQAAKGGTLFLDEIGDLPLAMQSKLLRAIQERVVRPLGSAQEDTVDVRVVSATHKDLGAAVASATFRQDLYYRLNVIEIGLPPLRERREDIPALCKDLLGRICHESGFQVPEISAQVLASLQVHPFQGNVRELENILHRAVALGEDGDLHLESPAAEYVAVPENLQVFLDGQERSILCKVLQETGFNRTAAAAKLGISLRQIRYRIARLNIVTPNADDAPEEY